MNSSLRHLALRLAVASPADRQWLLGQLTAPEAARVDALLREIHAQGLDRDAGLVAQVLGEFESVPAIVEEDDFARLLAAFDKPAWRALLLCTRSDAERRNREYALLIENPQVYRRLLSEFSAFSLPSAWADSLQCYEQQPSAGLHREQA